jgi:hypothetical protein
VNTSHVFETPRVTPLSGGAGDTPPPVVLRLTAGDTARIVRALEEVSSNLSDSPSGSRIAASYRHLAGLVRSQATHGPFAPAGL